MSEKQKVEVSPQAWLDLFRRAQPFLVAVADWADRHDLPVGVMVGALSGIADAAVHIGEGCTCDGCAMVEMHMQDEVCRRLVDGYDTAASSKVH